MKGKLMIQRGDTEGIANTTLIITDEVTATDMMTGIVDIEVHLAHQVIIIEGTGATTKTTMRKNMMITIITDDTEVPVIITAGIEASGTGDMLVTIIGEGGDGITM